MVAKLHLLQHEHTRQATTNRRWSELQAVPICTENNNFILTFSANKPHLEIITLLRSEFLLTGSNIFRLVDGDNVS